MFKELHAWWRVTSGTNPLTTEDTEDTEVPEAAMHESGPLWFSQFSDMLVNVYRIARMVEVMTGTIPLTTEDTEHTEAPEAAMHESGPLWFRSEFFRHAGECLRNCTHGGGL